MPPKKASKVISNPSFTKLGNLTVNDFKRLSCTSFTDVARKIHESWDDEPILIVGLNLSQDNSEIANAKTLFQGILFKNDPKVIKASNLWPFGENLSLRLNEIECQQFEFKGQLTSELVDSSDLDFSILRDGEELDLEELNIMGFTGFSCRVFLMPVAAQRMKATLLLYPLPVDELLQANPLTKNERFPGIVIHREEFELGFNPTSLVDKPVGGPILPAILPGTSLKAGSKVPQMAEVQARCADLLRQVISPECKANHSTLNTRWEEIRAGGESQLKLISPEFIWPEPAPVERASGKIININMGDLMVNKVSTKFLFSLWQDFKY